MGRQWAGWGQYLPPCWPDTISRSESHPWKVCQSSLIPRLSLGTSLILYAIYSLGLPTSGVLLRE